MSWADKTHCPQGHEYAGDNLRRTPDGKRKCRACERIRARMVVHHPLYWTWKQMLQRCENPRNHCYRRYGALGVTVCERWHSFENFVADMGERKIGHSIDRINPHGNYEPENCRWATAIEQRHNRRAMWDAAMKGKA